MEYLIGIDLGGTNIAIGLVENTGNIVREITIPTMAPRPAQALIQDITNSIEIIIKDARLDEIDIAGIGMGVPSPVHPVTSKLLHTYNLGLQDIDFYTLLKEKYPTKKITVFNDADCAVYGEGLFGNGVGYKSVFLFTIGTGLGTAFFLNGELFLGGTQYGIEFGHTTIVDNGRQCTCGKKGCLDAYVSINGFRFASKEILERQCNIPSWGKEHVCTSFSKLNPRVVFDAAKKGDLYAKQIVNYFANYLAIGVRNAIVSYRPDIILIGGGIGQAGNVLIQPLRQLVDQKLSMSDGIPPVPIKNCKLGNNAGVLGAAFLSSPIEFHFN